MQNNHNPAANCIFCSIIEGKTAAKKAYEDKIMVSVLDINPCKKGHLLVIPKQHIPIIAMLPQESFGHIFSLMPKFTALVKEAMVATGITIFIASGAAAGQQSPHFLFHIIPRDEDDRMFNFYLEENIEINKENAMKTNNAIVAELKSRMQRSGMQSISGDACFETESFIIRPAEKQQCIGHFVVLPKKEEQLESLSKESSVELFSLCSLTATVIFEALKPEGTNIIIKSGLSSDNPSGKLRAHILPRHFNDSLKGIFWKPMKNKPNLNEIAEKLSDKLIFLNEIKEEKKETETIDLDSQIEIISCEETEEKSKGNQDSNNNEEKEASDIDEIRKAISSLRQG